MAMLEVKDLEVYYGMIQAIKGRSYRSYRCERCRKDNNSSDDHRYASGKEGTYSV